MTPCHLATPSTRSMSSALGEKNKSESCGVHFVHRLFAQENLMQTQDTYKSRDIDNHFLLSRLSICWSPILRPNFLSAAIMANQYECLGPVDASMIKVRMDGQVVTLLGRKHINLDDDRC